MPAQFIKPMHPKTEIKPERTAIKKILDSGWVGQIKINGHRAQIHISSQKGDPIVVLNRQGRPHAKELPLELAEALRQIFMPQTGWNCVDAEWLKGDNKLFVFDILKHEDKLLKNLNYEQRLEFLPRVYRSDLIERLPLLRTVERCMAALDEPGEFIEGLVFKSLQSPGFNSTSIVRCRKNRG